MSRNKIKYFQSSPCWRFEQPSVYFLVYCLGDDDDADDPDSFCVCYAFAELMHPAKKLHHPLHENKSIGSNTYPSEVVRKSRPCDAGGRARRPGRTDKRKNPNCVFVWRVAEHFWEDRGVERLLWKIKHILCNVLRATKYSVLGEKQGQSRAPNNKKLLKNKPCLPRRLSSESNPAPDLLFTSDSWAPPFCLWEIQQIQLRQRAMVAGAATIHVQ